MGRIWILLALVLPGCLLAIACDEARTVTWENQTDSTVLIYLGDDLEDFDAELAPHSTKKLTTTRDVWEDVVVVRDSVGNELFRTDLSWDEFEDQDFRFEIRPDMIPQSN